MKLLVVSWGDFKRWKETKYRFGNETSVGPSTLPILQKAIEPDWTVIILSDTLGRDFSSLEALREDVRGRAMDFLDRIGAGREVDVIIAPGIGHFSHGTFRGSAMDAYNYILWRLSQIIPPSGDLEVHFDSTHGLNYMTLLAYRALKELLGIASIANKVKFTAYNSDPYVPGVTKELTINIIEKTHIPPLPLDKPAPGPSGLIKPFKNDLSGKEINQMLESENLRKRISEVKTRLDAWIGSVFFGLPLLFLEEFGEAERVEEIIEDVEYLWNSKINVFPGRVERDVSFGDGFSTLVKALFQLRALERFKFLPPSLENLYLISREVFRGSTRERINTEIGKIEDEAIEKMNRGKKTSWVLLREFLNYSRANTQVKPRNFLAHAGFEANVTEVMISQVGRNPQVDAKKYTYLRYTPDKKEIVRKLVSRALKDG